MEEHPIQGLMASAMDSIKQMVDVNTVIGDPVETSDGTTIIPVTRVACGFVAGGSEFDTTTGQSDDQGPIFPFGGGSGAGVSVKPMGFLVVSQGQVRLLPVDANPAIDRLIDLAPEVLDKVQKTVQSKPKSREYEM